ncbi:hypothetical protein PALS2_072 [Staphylococcus phage PALS_2]|nr:hypothetical protein PALS2_072 [Staphylococcus phage PALS_2]
MKKIMTVDKPDRNAVIISSLIKSLVPVSNIENGKLIRLDINKENDIISNQIKIMTNIPIKNIINCLLFSLNKF